MFILLSQSNFDSYHSSSSQNCPHGCRHYDSTRLLAPITSRVHHFSHQVAFNALLGRHRRPASPLYFHHFKDVCNQPCRYSSCTFSLSTAAIEGSELLTDIDGCLIIVVCESIPFPLYGILDASAFVIKHNICQQRCREALSSSGSVLHTILFVNILPALSILVFYVFRMLDISRTRFVFCSICLQSPFFVPTTSGPGTSCYIVFCRKACRSILCCHAGCYRIACCRTAPNLLVFYT